MLQRRARIAEDRSDRRAVLEIGHAAFGSDEPFEDYAEKRLGSPLRAAADWWLLESEGSAVASALCYPLRFGLPDGTVRGGFGLGSVATRPTLHRRGHGGWLCDHLAAHSAAQGRSLGLLFSAIPPGLYQRLGYVICPAWSHRCARLSALAESGPSARLSPLDPDAERADLAALYRRAHAGRLHLDRDEASWDRCVALGPEDRWWGLGPVGARTGYARGYARREAFEVLELFAPAPEDRAPMLRALAAETQAAGLAALEGWLPPCALVDAWFEPQSRAETLPMVRGADDCSRARFWGSDYF